MKIDNIILEYNRDKTVSKFADKIIHRSKHDTYTHLMFVNNWAKFKDERVRLVFIMNRFEETDPTPNKKYTVWLIRQWINEQFRFEDLGWNVTNVMKSFVEKIPAFRKEGIGVDINQYSFKELNDLVDSAKLKFSGREEKREVRDKAYQESEILYDGPLGKLVVPKTESASCFWGRGTRWCTAGDRDNQFETYSKDGPLFIWIESNGDRYQFHFESLQFMDARDRDLSHNKIMTFRNGNPITRKLFLDYERQLLDLQATQKMIEYCSIVLKAPWPEAEKFIKLSAPTAYEYAFAIIEGRWPPGEKVILTNPEYAMVYSSFVMKQRWPEAEPIISTDAESSYYYAKHVLKGRFPQAEPAINKSIYERDYNIFLHRQKYSFFRADE